MEPTKPPQTNTKIKKIPTERSHSATSMTSDAEISRSTSGFESSNLNPRTRTAKIKVMQKSSRGRSKLSKNKAKNNVQGSLEYDTERVLKKMML